MCAHGEIEMRINTSAILCVCLQVAYNIRIALVGHIQFPEVLSLNWIQSNFISSLMEKIMVIKTVREKVRKY